MLRPLVVVLTFLAAVPVALAQYSITEFALPSGAQPAGVAVGHDGNIWFTEYGRNRIGTVDLATGVVTDYPIPTPVSGPLSIAAGQSQSARWMFFTESLTSKIGVFDIDFHTFNELATPSANAGPMDIVLGPDGSMWFSEPNVSRIGKVDLFLIVGEFATPTASAYPSWLAAGRNGLVYFIESNVGNYGAINPANGSTFEVALDSSTTHPNGIGITTDNQLYAVDLPTSTVFRKNLNGVSAPYGFGIAAASPSSLGPLIVASDNNSLWIVDAADDKLFHYFANGSAVPLSLPAGSFPADVVLGPDGNLWVAEKHRDRIARVNLHALPGDANKDGQLTIADVFYVINYLFQGGPLP